MHKKDDEYFKHLEVKRRGNEDVDRMLRRFLKKVKLDGVLHLYNKRQHHVKKSTKRREKRANAKWLSKK